MYIGNILSKIPYFFKKLKCFPIFEMWNKILENAVLVQLISQFFHKVVNLEFRVTLCPKHAY